MTNISDFTNYRQLLQRVDDKFSGVASKYPRSFNCKLGCYSCCKSGLTVTNVEAKHIRAWIDGLPSDHQKEVLGGNKMSSQNGVGFCEFLSAEGRCTVYPVRPVVCRSHGTPLLVSHGDSQPLEPDVCPLNFKDTPLSTLEPTDWIRLDTLNTILAAVDINYDPEQAGKRVPLTPGSILGQST
jgi:Fe-S-cluster containining protein